MYAGLPIFACSDPGKAIYTYSVCIFDPKDLFSEVVEVVKRRLRCDGVHQHKALAVLHV